MRFQAQLAVVNGVVTVDPVASPEDVPTSELLGLPARPFNTDGVRVTLLALDAPAAEDVTVSVFVVDEDTLPDTQSADDPFSGAGAALRRFYLLEGSVTVAGGEAIPLATPVGGTLYIQVTADTLTTPRTLHVGVA